VLASSLPERTVWVCIAARSAFDVIGANRTFLFLRLWSGVLRDHFDLRRGIWEAKGPKLEQAVQVEDWLAGGASPD
jgi:hypothetical protein